jgi:hypothetical protein
MSTRLTAILALLGLAALACQAVMPERATPTPSNVLFQDDFAEPTSQWDRINTPEGITDYQDGAYRIYVNLVDSDIWANPGLDFGDVRVEVDAAKAGGDDNNVFGLICRYLSNDNFYFLVVSSDGYYGIGKVKDGVQKLIGTESMPPTEEVNKGDATNHLRADCVGDRLTLFVNGEKLGEQTDADFSRGDVGLFAGAFETPGTDIRFDNFSVLKP